MLPIVVKSPTPTAGHSDRLPQNLAAIECACRKPGPFVYRLDPERIERRHIRL